MSKLIALLALALAGALAAVLFLRRKDEESWGSVWSSAQDASSSLRKTASHEYGKAADKVAAAADDATSAVSDVADQLKGSASEAVQEAGKAADRTAAAADDATTGAASLPMRSKVGTQSRRVGRNLKR